MPDASRDPNTLHMSRVFDATPERVFDAWARQDHFVQWMCPPGVEVKTCEIDVRPGGAWRVGGRHGGDRVFASSGKYVEVKRPSLAVTRRWCASNFAAWETRPR
jgi:uncharacterized protein YndB with AHSA1/START domain